MMFPAFCNRNDRVVLVGNAELIQQIDTIKNPTKYEHISTIFLSWGTIQHAETLKL